MSWKAKRVIIVISCTLMNGCVYKPTPFSPGYIAQLVLWVYDGLKIIETFSFLLESEVQML